MGLSTTWLIPRRPWFWLLILFILYCLAGFLLAPWLVERQLVRTLDDRLSLQAEVGGLAINPLTLSLTVENFAASEPDRESLVTLEQLFVDLELCSLWRRALCFDHIQWTGLATRFERFEDGTNTLSRLAQRWRASGPPRDSTEPPAEGNGVPRLLVARFLFEGGRLTFIDHTRDDGFRTTVDLADFVVEDLATLPDTEGNYDIAVVAENGASVKLAGALTLTPLRVDGSVEAQGPFLPLAHRYFSDILAFDLDRGDLNARFDYLLTTGSEGSGIGAQVTDLRVTLSDLAVTESDSDNNLLAIPEMQLLDGEMRWPGQTLSAGTLHVESPAITARRDKDGRINLLTLLDIEPGPAPADDTGKAAWHIAADKLSVAKARLRFVDNVPESTADIVVDSLNATLEGFSNEPGAAAGLKASATLASGGELTFQGSFSALPAFKLEGKVDIDQLAVMPAQPYLREFARIAIQSGTISAAGAFSVSPADPANYRGSGSLSDLSVQDAVQNEQLLAWEALQAGEIAVSLGERRLEVGAITLNKPYARIEIEQDRSTNIGRVLIGDPEKPANSPDARKAPSGEPASDGQSGTPGSEKAETQKPAPFRVLVSRFAVQDGSADFTDLSLPLPFSAKLSELAGAVSAISTASREPATLDLKGRVGRFGQVTVAGKTLPTAPLDSTRIDLVFRNVDMPPLSPYFIAFAGRRIADGKMDLDLDYRVEEGRLNGDNRIVMTDLRLGERVDHPEAKSLPLDLALALLRDGDGVIRLAVPVTGDVGDPAFAYGTVIRQALTNVITGIVVAPFRLLANLVGAEPDSFRSLAFDPGQSTLAPPEEEKLVKLARALSQRPRLEVEIPGAFAPDADRAALREQQLENTLEERLAETAGSAANPGERRQKVLEALYRERGLEPALDVLRIYNSTYPEGEAGKPALDAVAYRQALRRKLIDAQAIPDSELHDLARARARAIIDRLKQAGDVDEGRLLLREPVSVATGDRGRVLLPLDVSAAK